jgi:hypothetical protein
MSTSILSRQPDGFGFYYGYKPHDHRQINLRYEYTPGESDIYRWAIYVGGERISYADDFQEGEEYALRWMCHHPADADEPPDNS